MTDENVITALFITVMAVGFMLSVAGQICYMVYCERNGSTLYEHEEKRVIPSMALLLRDIAAPFWVIPFLILFGMFVTGILR